MTRVGTTSLSYVLVLPPSEHATALEGRGQSEYFYCKNGKLCCILHLYFLKALFLCHKFCLCVCLFLYLFLFSPFSLHFQTLNLHWSPKSKRELMNSGLPRVLLRPVMTTPPTSSSSPSLTTAALFADNFIVKAANGQPQGKLGDQSQLLPISHDLWSPRRPC